MAFAIVAGSLLISGSIYEGLRMIASAIRDAGHK